MLISTSRTYILAILFSVILTACGGGGGGGGGNDNAIPVAATQSLTTDQGQTLNITLSGTDNDGSIVSYTIVAQPINGTLSGTAPNLVYTSIINFNGSDSFSFSVTDDAGDTSPEASVNITINPLAGGNLSPTAESQELSLQQNSSLTITLVSTDTDGTIASYQFSSSPTNGILSGSAPSLVYTPNTDFSGTDGFTYRAVDDQGGVSTLTAISLEITPEGTTPTTSITPTVSITPTLNVAPTANSQSVTVGQNESITITLSGTDSDGTVDSYIIKQLPDHGALRGLGGALYSYTHDLNFNGTDSFSFSVFDDDGSVSNEAEVSIEVIKRTLIATPQQHSINEDTTLSISLSITDDDTNVSYQITSDPSNGSLSGSGAELIYTPNADFNGSDQFSYSVTDISDFLSSSATISINIISINDLPTADAGSDQSANENTPVTLIGQGTDVEGEVSFQWAQLSSQTASLNSANSITLTFTAPNVNTPTTLTFQLTVTDSANATATDTVSINLQPVVVGANRGVLGPVNNARVEAFTLDDTSYQTALATAITSNAASATEQGGWFDLLITDNSIDADDWLVIRLSGGSDVDADDDATMDATATPVQGEFFALAQRSTIEAGAVLANPLTDLIYLEILDANNNDLSNLLSADIQTQLNAMSSDYVGEINGDNEVNYADILAFDPPQDRLLSKRPWSTFLTSYVAAIQRNFPSISRRQLDRASVNRVDLAAELNTGETATFEVATSVQDFVTSSITTSITTSVTKRVLEDANETIEFIEIISTQANAIVLLKVVVEANEQNLNIVISTLEGDLAIEFTVAANNFFAASAEAIASNMTPTIHVVQNGNTFTASISKQLVNSWSAAEAEVSIHDNSIALTVVNNDPAVIEWVFPTATETSIGTPIANCSDIYQTYNLCANEEIAILFIPEAKLDSFATDFEAVLGAAATATGEDVYTELQNAYSLKEGEVATSLSLTSDIQRFIDNRSYWRNQNQMAVVLPETVATSSLRPNDQAKIFRDAPHYLVSMIDPNQITPLFFDSYIYYEIINGTSSDLGNPSRNFCNAESECTDARRYSGLAEYGRIALMIAKTPLTPDSTTDLGRVDFRIHGVVGVDDSTSLAYSTLSLADIAFIPRNIATTVDNQKVKLNWDAVTGATSYNLYWSSESDCEIVEADDGTKITGVTSPYTHSGLTNDTNYCYAISAVNNEGESVLSNNVEETPRRYSKIGSSGEVLADNASSWSCVRDNSTDLIWEMKTNSNKDTTYRWGGVGTEGADGTRHNDWDALVNGIVDDDLCGYSDWRVPSDDELSKIIYCSEGSSDSGGCIIGSTQPTINTTYFPNTKAGSYWTTTASTGFYAIAVGFKTGSAGGLNRNMMYRVRLVSGD